MAYPEHAGLEGIDETHERPIHLDPDEALFDSYHQAEGELAHIEDTSGVVVHFEEFTSERGRRRNPDKQETVSRKIGRASLAEAADGRDYAEDDNQDSEDK